MDDFDKNSYFSVMNDNNLFSWFCLEIIGCCFGHSELTLGLRPRDKFLRPKQQPLISKQNHENKCYAVIILKLVQEDMSNLKT